MSDKISKTEAEWREQLTPEQYRIAREHGTERAFSGEYWNSHDPGTYRCIGCGEAVFDAAAKFESGTGWPSFHSPADESAVEETRDMTHGTVRTEVHCRKCGAHLGHVFPDGPRPTGQRYCINSASLKLTPPASSP